MVEVENTAHEEEGEVMEAPAQQKPASTGQETVDVICRDKSATFAMAGLHTTGNKETTPYKVGLQLGGGGGKGLPILPFKKEHPRKWCKARGW